MDVLWREQAACRSLGADLFHDGDRVDEALALCSGCSVVAECRSYAGKFPPARGSVWGGRVMGRVGRRSDREHAERTDPAVVWAEVQRLAGLAA